MKASPRLSNRARIGAPFRIRVGASAAFMALVLAGCGAIPEQPAGDPRTNWQAHQRWVESLDVWRTSGRVAVKVPNDGWSASLRWQQGDSKATSNYRIALSGPFGQGGVRITGGANSVELRTADGQVKRAATPEQLIAEALKAEVPVSLLRYWILGRPAPQPVALEVQWDGYGRAQRLLQAGWVITYQEYETLDDGALPKRLLIERDPVAARFVLSSWKTGL